MTGEIIQIVEDEGLIALHITEILEKAGYRVLDPAYSGEMALRVLETFPIPGLILMDIGLGGSLDGIETARQIQQRFPVPLIFITAYTSENLLARMLEVAPEGVITKPFVDTDLLDLVGKALSHTATKARPGNNNGDPPRISSFCLNGTGTLSVDE